MMNLEQVRKIVAFMKENGVMELSYTGKDSSISLTLAPPPPPRGKRGPRPVPGWEEPRPAAHTEEEDIPEAFAADDPITDSDTLKEMAKEAKAAAKVAAREAKAAAKSAAKEAKAAAKEAARAAKEAMKNYQEAEKAAAQAGAEDDADGPEIEVEFAFENEPEEPESPEETSDIDIELPDAMLDEEPAKAAPEAEPAAPAADKEPLIDLDTEAIKQGAKQAAAFVTDAAVTTAKIGVQLGKQGFQYLKGKGAELLAKAEEEAAKAEAAKSAPAEVAPAEPAPEAPAEAVVVTLVADEAPAEEAAADTPDETKNEE
jgi:nicotinate-nucleotide--dimethylbenzimidazole phosphoribosyltransferase